jgi:hypothetical protein
MTSSSKKRTMAMEKELQMYWQLMSRSAELYNSETRDPELDEIRDELEVLRDYTDWPRLRHRCVDALHTDALFRRPAKLA